MARGVLLVSGYGAGEEKLAGLYEALEGKGTVRLAAGADTARAREAYAHTRASCADVALAGVGAGCWQALLLAQAFGAEALVCALPGADGRAGDFKSRLIAMANLFAVSAPTLVVDMPFSRVGRRLYEGIGAKDKRFAPYDSAKGAIQTILEHFRRTDATHSFAARHDWGI